MAQPIAVRMIGRLKDKRLAISERLKLAKTLWQNEYEVGPNKQQVIIDSIITVLINNKKRCELNIEEKHEVWQILCSLLHSPEVQQPSVKHATITLRPTTAQVLLDSLNTHRQQPDVLRLVLDCCQSVLLSPAMSYIITSRLDVLASLCSIVCHLTMSLPESELSSSSLLPLLSQLAVHLWQCHHRSQLSSTQMLQTVTEKLFWPVLRVTYYTFKNMDQTELNDAARSLNDFLLATLLHEGHMKLFKVYLDGVGTDQKISQLPLTVSSIFDKIRMGFQSDVNAGEPDLEYSLQRKVILHFLPRFFQRAAKLWRGNEQLSFQLFVHLNSLMGIPVCKGKEEQSSVDVALEPDYVGTVTKLLSVIQNIGIYNVAADRARDGTQFQYLCHLLKSLMFTSMCEELSGALVELLQLNHLILEPLLPTILHHCSFNLTQLPKKCRTGLDNFLSKLMSTYSLLHQVPRLYSFLLQLNAQSPQHLTDVLALPRFSQELSLVANTLTPNTAVELWAKLQQEADSCIQLILKDQQAALPQNMLWSTSLLLHHYLSHIPDWDASVNVLVMNRVGLLVSDLEEKLINSLLQHFIHIRKQDKLYKSVLLLAVCLGKAKLNLASHRISQVNLPAVTSEHLPFSIKPFNVVRKKKATKVDAVVKYLGDILTTQRLLVLQREGSSVDLSPLLYDLNMEKESDLKNGLCNWDGNLSSVNKNTYFVARWHLLAVHSMSLLPLLVRHHPVEVAKMLVHSIVQSVSQSQCSSKSLSIWSVAEHLLMQTATLNSKSFCHNFMCVLWQHFTSSATHKKSSSSSTVFAVLKCLGSTHLNWTDISDRDLKSVVASIQEILSASSGQTISLTETQIVILKLLQKLPLSDIPAGTRLQCILGLLTVLCCQKRKPLPSSWDGSQLQSDQSVVEMLCHLLIIMLEASVGTSLFVCIPADVILQCLHTMIVQWKAAEHSCLGILLKKAVSTVMADFQNVLHLADFISDLVMQLKSLCGAMAPQTADLNKASYRTLLIFTDYILCEIQRYLKKDFYRRDVQSASCQYFRLLSVAVDSLVDTHQRLYPTEAIHPALLRCFTAVTFQRCMDGAENHDKAYLQRAQSVLSSLSLTNNQQGSKSLMEELAFVLCFYRHSSLLSTSFTPQLTYTRTLWMALLEKLDSNYTHRRAIDKKVKEDSKRGTEKRRSKSLKRKCQEQHVSETSIKIQRLDSECSLVPSDISCDKLRLLSTETLSVSSANGQKTNISLPQRLEDHCNRDENDECKEKILETMTIVLTSCPVSLFTELLQHVISHQVSLMPNSLLVWSRIVSCNALTKEQKTQMETFCTTVLQQSLQLMQQFHMSPHTLTVELGLPILRCLTSMLTKHKFLSSKGTVLCLLTVALVPLDQMDYSRFFPLVLTVCDVLHAVFTHHPHTVLMVFENYLALVTSVLKECVCRGEQKLLLTNPDYIKPMTDCAEAVSRLMTLFLSHRAELQRVVVTVISDYANAVKSITLLPVIKKFLLAAIYACLDVCDNHSFNQLRLRLSPGVREVFHLLHEDYMKYHKYTGKV